MMDLESILTVGLTKEQNNKLNAWVGDSQERFDQLMYYFLHEEMRVCQRSAWVFGKVCEDRPQLMLKWLPQILKALEEPKHDAIVRNTVRAFQFMDDFPEEYEGEIFEKCFDYLHSPKYPIAFKAFSMTVCRKIAIKYPELKDELIAVIEEVMENASSGIISRGKKEIKILQSPASKG